MSTDDELIAVTENLGLQDIKDVLDAKLGPIKTSINQISGKVNDIPGAVQGKLGFSAEQLEVLKGTDLADKISEGIADLQEAFEDARVFAEDAAAFGESGCNQYVSDLTSFLLAVDGIISNVPSLSANQFQLQPSFDPAAIEGLVGAFGCVVLYPVSLVLPLEDIQVWLDELSTGLDVAQGLLVDLYTQSSSSPEPGAGALPGVASGSEPLGSAHKVENRAAVLDGCEAVDSDRAVIKAKMAGLLAGSLIMKLLSAALDPDPVVLSKLVKKPVPKFGPVRFGIHGYSGTSITKPKGWNFGLSKMAALAHESLASWSSLGFRRVRHCQLVVKVNEAQTSLDEIDEQLQNVHTKLDGLGAGTPGSPQVLIDLELRLKQALDLARSDLSSEIFEIGAKTEAHSSAFNDWAELDLRLRIEEQLVSSRYQRIGILMRPEFAGGLLETVRAVVEAALVGFLQSGGDVSYAQEALDLGDEALAAGKYQRAYLLYAKAYRLTVPRTPRSGFGGLRPE